MSRVCQVCKVEKCLGEFGRDASAPLGINRKCFACNRAIGRAVYRRRAKASRQQKLVWLARNPEKRKAHKEVERAIERGDITRQPCKVCGNPKADAHHDDYTKPLEVDWLCRLHHAERHMSNGEAV